MEVHFKQNLRDQMDYLGITTQELANKTGISKRTIENYLSKRESIPPADYACLIAKALGVTVEWLVTGIAPTENISANLSTSKLLSLLHDIEKLEPKVQEAITTLIKAASAFPPSPCKKPT